MADVNANIGVHIDTSGALAELKALQRQLATFHSSVAKNSAAAAQAQKGLQTNLLNSINATGKFHAQMGVVRSSTDSFTHALEKNKLSMREYFRYAGGSTRTFGKLFKSEFNTIGKVAEERVKKMQTQYIKMGRDASGAIKSMSITPRTLDMTNYANKTAVAAQKQAIFNQLLKQGSTNILNFGKNTQWSGRQLMVGFTVPLMYFGGAAAKVFMDLEKQAIRFKRVYGDMFTTTEETNDALENVKKLAEEFTKYGVAVAETMEMAANAAAMGKTGADLTAQVAQATRLAILGGVEQAQALETTISVTNAFGVAAEDLAGKINFLNAVENQTVVSIEDLTIAIPKAGPVVKQLGGDVEDLAFFLTAMKEGGINASEGANALKSGLASLINPTKKASDMLAGMGVNIKAIVEGNKGDIKGTVIDFAQALDTLDPLSRARAIEQLFGKFQFSRLSTLFQNVTKDGTQAAKVLKLSGDSIEELAIMAERELGVLENSIGTDFKESIEKLKLAIAPIGGEFLKAITPIAKSIGSFLEKFNNLGDGTKKFIVIATTLVGVIGPVLLMTFGLLANGVANIIKLFITMRSGFLRAGTNTQLLAQQTSYLNTEQLEAATVAASLNQAHSRLTQSFNMEATAVRLLRQAYLDATLAARNFAMANPGMMMPKGAVGGKVPKKFAGGTTGLPGPKGAGDIIPVLGAPGEAIIPAETAQDNRFKPIIQALVDGTLQGFEAGTVDLGGKSFATKSQGAARSLQNKIIELQSKGISEQKIVNALEKNIERGRPMTASQLERRLSINRGSSAKTSAPSSIRSLTKQSQTGFVRETRAIKEVLKRQGIVLTKAQQNNLFGVQSSHIEEVRNAGAKQWNSKNLVADLGYVNNYLNTVKGKLGKNLSGMSDLQLKSMGIDRSELKKLQSGTHPTTAASAQTLRGIAAYDARINPNSYQAKTVLAGLEYRSKSNFYSKPMKTLADVQSKTKSGIVNGQTGKAKSPALSVVGGSASDNRQVAIGKNETILNKKTTTALRSGRGVSVPGIGRFGLMGAEVGIPKGQSVTSPGMAASKVQQGFKAEQNSLRRQIEKVEQQRLAALKQETKIVQEKNKISTQIIPLTKEDLKNQKREVRAQRAQRVGRMAGPVAGIAGIGAMAGFATGNSNLGMGMMAVSGIASIAPMLTNPLGIAVAAAATLAGGFFLLNKRMDDATKKQVAYVNSVTAGTKKMQKVGELTGNVGASQLAQRQRDTGARTNEFRTGYDREDNQFGTNFLSSEVGKEIFKGFNDTVAKDGPKAAKLLATQLAAYISDGVLSAEQANSVARAIGINLGDMSVSTNISGELRTLIGPDGQDILKNPLKVRLSIITAQENFIDDIKDKLKVARSDEFVAQVAVINAKNLEIVQAQRDAQYQTNQAIIDGLEKQKATTTDKTKQLELENQIITAKAKQKSEDTLLAEKSKQIIKDAENLYNSAIGNRGKFMDALGFGIEAANKDNPFLSDFKDKTAAISNTQAGMGLEVQIKTAVLGGQLNIPTALKLLEMFGGTQAGEAKLKTVIETALTSQDPGVFQRFMEIMSGKNVNPKIQMDILTDQENFEDVTNVLNKLKDFDGDALNLEVLINTIGLPGLTKLAKQFKAVEKIKGPITVKTLAEISTITDDPTLNMSGLVDIWSKYENASDVIKKTVIQEYISVFKSIGDKEVEDLINNELAKGGGSPDRMDERKKRLEAKYYTYEGVGKDRRRIPNAPAVAAALVSQSAVGAPNEIPKGPGANAETGGQKNTTFDDILQTLKRTRDATIDVTKGAKELMRVLGGTKDITLFNGIDQQLSKLGANSDFIDFVGGLENAVKEQIIKINEDGVVSFGKFGEAAKKAYDEKQLGLFSAANAQAITESMKQRDAFVKLKAAGLDTANAQELLADKTFMVSLAAQKNSGEIKKMIKEYQNLKATEKITQEITDPEQAFKDQTKRELEFYDFLERQARASVKLEVDRINKLIDANDRLIETKERAIEEEISRPIDKFNQDLAIIDRAITKINEKYDAQENALEQISSLNDDIAARESSRITIADALTRGDISAAAKAIQERRAEEARKAKENSSKLLQIAREKEISKLTNADGLTKIQIEEKIYSLEQQRLPLIAAIVKLQDDNYKLQNVTLRAQEDSLKKTLEGIDAARFAYEQQVIAIDKSKFAALGFNKELESGEATLLRMKTLWELINSKGSAETNTPPPPTNTPPPPTGDDPFAEDKARLAANKIAIEELLKKVQAKEKIKDDPLPIKINPKLPAINYMPRQVPYNPLSAFSAPTKPAPVSYRARAMGGTIPKVRYEPIPSQIQGFNTGGIIPKYFVAGGYSRGSDTVPAMLTPGEFVVRRNAVDSFGVNNLNKINDGSYGGSSVYNYSLNVNVKSDSSPDDIAKTVMTQIRRIDNQRIKGQK